MARFINDLSIGVTQKKCSQIKTLKWIHYKPSLFQHVGTTSSLKGKVQKLKVRHSILSSGYCYLNLTFDFPQDKNFGKLALFTSHKNPPAKVSSPIKAYKQYTIQRAYNGETFFWGLMPEAGDVIDVLFEKPVSLQVSASFVCARFVT